MTKEEALDILKEIKTGEGDTEADHVRADEVLCSLLETLGYSDVVEAWNNIDKWYA